MPGRLPYVKRRFYPHMVGDEIEIWGRFVDMFPNRFDSVDYDFRVGEGTVIEGGDMDSYVRMAVMLSQKRIDVIGWVGDIPTIIEVKRRVGLSTLGQVLGYRVLFLKDFKHFGFPDLLVVCAAISPDDHYVLKENKVQVEVV